MSTFWHLRCLGWFCTSRALFCGDMLKEEVKESTWRRVWHVIAVLNCTLRDENQPKNLLLNRCLTSTRSWGCHLPAVVDCTITISSKSLNFPWVVHYIQHLWDDQVFTKLDMYFLTSKHNHLPKCGRLVEVSFTASVWSTMYCIVSSSGGIKHKLRSDRMCTTCLTNLTSSCRAVTGFSDARYQNRPHCCVVSLLQIPYQL